MAEARTSTAYPWLHQNSDGEWFADTACYGSNLLRLVRATIVDGLNGGRLRLAEDEFPPHRREMLERALRESAPDALSPPPPSEADAEDDLDVVYEPRRPQAWQTHATLAYDFAGRAQALEQMGSTEVGRDTFARAQWHATMALVEQGRGGS